MCVNNHREYGWLDAGSLTQMGETVLHLVTRVSTLSTNLGWSWESPMLACRLTLPQGSLQD